MYKRYTIVNIPMKRCSTSRVNREMKIKSLDDTTHPPEWLKLKSMTIPSVDENVKATETLMY